MMENGVEVAGGSPMGENRTAEDKILVSRAEEKAACGSDEMKDADGGDVFEMAPTETPRSFSEDILDEDGNVEKVGNLDGSLEVDRNSNAGSENDNFEEAVGVPANAAMAEVAYKQTPYVKSASDEVSGSGKVGLVDNEHHVVKEVSNVGVIDDKKVSQDADTADGSSDLVVEKSEKDITEIVNTDKNMVLGNSATGDMNIDGAEVPEELENGGAKNVGLGDSNSQQKVKSSGDILHQDDNREAVKETSCNSEREYRDREVKELEDTSALLYTEHQHDKVEKVEDNLVTLGVQPEDIKEETSVSQGLGHLDDTGQELKKSLSDLDMENQEDSGSEMKDVSDTINSEHLGENCKLADNLQPSVKESPVILGTGGLSSIEDPMAKGEKVQSGSLPSVADSAAEKGEKVQSGSLPFVKDGVAEKGENVQPGFLPSVEGYVAEKGENVLPGSLPSVEDSVAENVKPGSLPSVEYSVGENVQPGNLPSIEDNVADKGGNVRPGSLPYVGDPVAEKGDNFQSGNLPAVEDPMAERGEKVQPQSLPSVVDSVAEKSEKVQFGTSDLGRKIFKGSQHQRADENVEVSNGAAHVSEQKVGNDGALRERIQTNRGQEIKREADVSSSSGKSANPAPVPGRPAGLGRAAPLLEPAPRLIQQTRANGTVVQMQNQLAEESMNVETEENDETREKLQMIRVKFLRLAHRLGQTPHNVVVAQVLYRLGLAEQLRGRNGGRVAAFSFDRASAMAEQLEAAGQEPLDFSCTIMVLGKTGVGKSATINSIFDEVKFGTDAFQFGTKRVQDVVGTVQGIKVRVIDTPGLLPSWSDQRQNEKILHSVKRFIKKTPPDIVLYLDRLDMQSRDFSDMPLLRTITEIFGPFIWFNAIVVLTHAASAPPEGPNGTATSYDMFVTQRSHVVQQAIRQAAGDMRLMNPVSLVENHSACRTNRAGQRVLPNGQVWKPHLLLLSFASKILAEANALLKLQDSPPGKPFATRTRAPPLPFLLSSLLQSRPQLKLPQEQFGDDDDTLDDDLDESSDSDGESEYDGLPPFKRLTKAQLGKLTKAQRKAYYDELEYREKLFMKKQLKEEKKRRKMMKKMADSTKDFQSDYSENVEEESGGAASVPVPMPDLALPASFDSENPTHRYRCLDSSNQWLVRPVLEPHGWDHDVGYEGINVERLFVVKDNIPVSFSGQVTKDKKDANIHMEIASSVKHGEGKATSLGFDMQTVGKDIAYTLRSESRFCNYSMSKATAGLSATILGDALTAGVKIEDKLIVKKRLHVVVSGGAVTGRGDVAYGGSLEATLRDKDHPLGRSLTTFGLSIMDWHGDLAIGWNFQSQIPIGRFTNLIGRVNVNNRGSGQVSVRLNSSEQLQIALIGLVPLLRKLLGYPQ